MKAYCTSEGRWIALGLAFPTSCVVYRESMIKAAGFSTIPRDLDGFLKLCRALSARGTPAGFALGNAIGDGTTWCHWLVWSHGGKLVDESGRVTINSKQTVAALEYARELYPTLVPGTLSWLDPSNNKAFLAGQVSLTYNGISIYYAAKNSPDPALKAIAVDMQHAHFPVGPVGRPTELSPFAPAWVFNYTRYPNAAREYLRFMLERDRYEAWLKAAQGYFAQTAARLRVGSDLDRRPQEHAVPRRAEHDAAPGLRRQGRCGLRLGGGRLRRRQHGGRGSDRGSQPAGRCSTGGGAGATVLQSIIFKLATNRIKAAPGGTRQRALIYNDVDGTIDRISISH